MLCQVQLPLAFVSSALCLPLFICELQHVAQSDFEVANKSIPFSAPRFFEFLGYRVVIKKLILPRMKHSDLIGKPSAEIVLYRSLPHEGELV